MIRKWLFALECECSNVSWERQFPSSYMCVLGTTYREDGDMCEREREREKRVIGETVNFAVWEYLRKTRKDEKVTRVR